MKQKWSLFTQKVKELSKTAAGYMSQHWMEIAIGAMCVLIASGIAMTVYFHTMIRDKNVIEVEIEGERNYSVTFDRLNLAPGEQSQYYLRLSSDEAKKYDLTLDFKELGQSQTLKDYAYVRVEWDGQVLCDKLLTEIFDEEPISLEIDFSQGKKNDILISYRLPEEVGNEAQNAKADFELRVTAGNR